MALRVLLADESSTIKKVFQLALQDFGVEVRPVNIGVDVASVAKNFKPDIIFADVLLQKKNGYEVCAELKGDSQLRGIPVVLMWSGFMELDEDKYQAAQANAQLEKPFDVAALRKLIGELVPRTQSHALSEFLSFPKVQAEATKPAELGAGGGAASESADEDFTQISIPKLKEKGSAPATDKYRLNLKPEELDPGHIHVDYELPSENIQLDEIFKSPESEKDEFTVSVAKKTETKIVPELDLVELDGPPEPPASPMPSARPKPPPVASAAPPPPPPAAKAAAQIPSLTAEQIETIIRKQSTDVIESVVWKVIPELASQIIERELKKLLKERDSHPF